MRLGHPFRSDSGDCRARWFALPPSDSGAGRAAAGDRKTCTQRWSLSIPARVPGRSDSLAMEPSNVAAWPLFARSLVGDRGGFRLLLDGFADPAQSVWPGA